MVTWPEAGSARDSIAAVSAGGGTVRVPIRRSHSSRRRSIAFVVRADFHRPVGRQVRANNRWTAAAVRSSSATAPLAGPVSLSLRESGPYPPPADKAGTDGGAAAAGFEGREGIAPRYS